MTLRILAATALAGCVFALGGAVARATDGAAPLDWQVYAINPWIEADADQLPVLLREPADSLTLSGPRNDWLTGALAIGSSSTSKVQVSLDEPDHLQKRIQMRVVGQVRERRNRHIEWDPLISREDLPDKARKAYNFEEIKDFPKLTVTPKVPAFLWFTVNLTGIATGEYDAKLTVTQDNGSSRVIPLHIRVLPAELPVDSPLYCIMWNWTSSTQMIHDFVDHGVNVAFRNHEDTWKAGARFLLFQLSASFGRKPLDEARKKQVAEELDTIRALVKRLGVPKGQWAVYPCDEPMDNTAPLDLTYARLIKKLRPDVPLWYNPAWIELPGGHGNRTTSRGTLQLLAPMADFWCPYCSHLWDGSPALSFMKTTHKPVWFYEIMEAAVTRRPSVGHEMLRKGPWIAWKYGLQGFGVFSANDIPNDCWDDLDPDSSAYPNYSCTYPGASSVMSSRGFEALRQGVQEYKRLYTLRKLGAPQDVLKAWAEIGVSAQSVQTLDTVRDQMDDQLVHLSAKAK